MNKNFFEIGVRYYKNVEAEGLKLVNELYVINAASFADAEAQITEYMKPYIDGEFIVSSVKKSNLSEIIVNEEIQAKGREYKWYKVKINLIIDEIDGVEKKKPYYILVNDCSVDNAHEFIIGEKEDGMKFIIDGKETTSYFEISSIDETKIVDVINISKMNVEEKYKYSDLIFNGRAECSRSRKKK